MGKPISESKFRHLIREAVEDIALTQALRQGKGTEVISKKELLAFIDERI